MDGVYKIGNGPNLLVEHAPRRYTLHDLLRAYARELARNVEDKEQRRAAIHRLLDHYLHTAHPAAMLLDPTREPIAPIPRLPGVTPEELGDDTQALGWFTTELPVLLAALERATGNGFHHHAWQLAWTLVTFMERRGRWHDFLAAQLAGLTAARQLADPFVEARAHRYVASAYAYLGRLDEAREHLTQTRDISHRSKNPSEEAQAYLHLARIDEMQGHNAQGLAHAREAMDLFHTLGHRRGSADALNYVGWYQALLGDYHQALGSARQALTLYQQLGQPHGEGAARDSLGYINHHLGNHAQAIADYEGALAIYQRLGDRYFEAHVLDHLADTHHATGSHRAARDGWYQALMILDDLGDPDADRIRAKGARQHGVHDAE